MLTLNLMTQSTDTFTIVRLQEAEIFVGGFFSPASNAPVLAGVQLVHTADSSILRGGAVTPLCRPIFDGHRLGDLYPSSYHVRCLDPNFLVGVEKNPGPKAVKAVKQAGSQSNSGPRGGRGGKKGTAVNQSYKDGLAKCQAALDSQKAINGDLRDQLEDAVSGIASVENATRLINAELDHSAAQDRCAVEIREGSDVELFKEKRVKDVDGFRDMPVWFKNMHFGGGHLKAGIHYPASLVTKRDVVVAPVTTRPAFDFHDLSSWEYFNIYFVFIFLLSISFLFVVLNSLEGFIRFYVYSPLLTYPYEFAGIILTGWLYLLGYVTIKAWLFPIRVVITKATLVLFYTGEGLFHPQNGPSYDVATVKRPLHSYRKYKPLIEVALYDVTDDNLVYIYVDCPDQFGITSEWTEENLYSKYVKKKFKEIRLLESLIPTLLARRTLYKAMRSTEQAVDRVLRIAENDPLYVEDYKHLLATGQSLLQHTALFCVTVVSQNPCVTIVDF